MKTLLIALLWSAAAVGVQATTPKQTSARLAELDTYIGRLESATRQICRDADRGLLKDKVTLAFGADTLTYSAATLDGDLDRALALIRKYQEEKRALLAERGEASRPATPEDKLRRAEAQGAGARAARIEPGKSPNVLEAYEKGHGKRQEELDRAAEADMKRVAEERRLAEAEQSARRAAEQKVQDQNAKWQMELDARAEKEAAEEEAWRREHSPGAFFKGLVRTIVGGAVTSLTGGFAQGVGSGYADYVIRKKFPDFHPTGEYEGDDD